MKGKVRWWERGRRLYTVSFSGGISWYKTCRVLLPELQPGKCGLTRMLRFSRAIVCLYRQYLVQTFRWDETPLWRMSIVYLSCLLCPRMRSLKCPRRTCYLSSIETIAINCSVFEKTAFCVRVSGERQTDRRTDKQTDGQHHRVKPRFCEWCLNPLDSASNHSATSNTKLVHWPLMGWLLHLVQRGGAWAGCGPAQSPPNVTTHTSTASIPITVLLYDWWSVALRF